MFRYALDHYADLLTLRVQDSTRFAKRFGDHLVPFYQRMPALFYFLRRVPLDCDFSASVRHLSAAAALYIAEQQDYLQDSANPEGAVVDDLWMAYEAVARLVHMSEEDKLKRHWRSNTLTFSEIVALASKRQVIEERVAPKVLEQCQRYLT